MIKIAPSILSADFTNLISDIRDVRSGGAELLHIDVMDGLFVPNITVGLPVVKAIRDATDMTLDVHLMITKPGRYVTDFCSAGADIVVFHVEADEPQDIHRAIEAVRAQGRKVGLSVKPRSPAEVLIPYLELLDVALVMTVEPGFGGQSFMSDQLAKIRKLRNMLDRVNPSCDLEVDGGIDSKTASLVKDAGANVLVAGSAVFGAKDRTAAIKALREA